MAANKARRKPGCACCAHWSATAYNLLQFFDTVLAAFEITVSVKERLLQEINGLKRRLLVYDNSNTPSSQTPISEKNEAMPRMILTMSPRKRSRVPSRDMGKPRKDFRLKPRNTTSVPHVQDATERI